MDPPSNLELKDPFKTIFFLFRISSVFPITFKCNSSCKAKLLSLYSILLLVCFILPSVQHLEVVSSNLVHKAAIVIGIIFRFRIGQRVRRMQGLALHLQCQDSNNSSRWRWVKVWAVVSTALHIIQLVSTFLDYLKSGFVSNPFLNAALSLSLAIVHVVVFVLPINTFAIFYVVACRHVRSDIEDFATSLSSSSSGRRDFVGLLRSFRSIRRRVGLVDDELSFPLFCSVLLSSITTFMALSYLLMDPHYSLFIKLSILAHFAYIQASFLAMTVSASAVSEAAGRVAEAAEGLPEVEGPHRRMGAPEQRFLAAAARGEMALTAWKIVPIRRNFIIGTTGAIFTYVILIDGFLRVTISGE